MRQPATRQTMTLLLAGGLLLAAVQQQWLLTRPPRLLELKASGASSGPAALDLRFSRPMQRRSLEQASRLQPALAHQWLGETNPLRLLLSSGQRLRGPLALLLQGQDLRHQGLARQLWHWDPRPRLLAVVPREQGEQLQLLGHDNRWRALSPVLPRILTVQPLGDGSGVALVSGGDDGADPANQDVWLLPLEQRNLSRTALAEPRPGRLQRLNRERLIFAHLSSNRRGDLLIQASSRSAPRGSTQLRQRDGRTRTLPLKASGPMQLLPEGGALVMPELEGLSLRALPGGPERRQILPGSRDLSSFCPVSGRALLVRHWPDFRRSLELVEPGQPPRQLWLGSAAVLGSACDRGGERVWLLLSEWQGQQRSELLALDRRGRVLQRRTLRGWQVEPGAPLLFDPTGQQLLISLRPDSPNRGSVLPPQPVLIDATSLELRPIPMPSRLALWLPAS